MFRTYPAKSTAVMRNLKRKARSKHLSPDDIEIYPSNRISTTKRGAVVTRQYKALAIPERLRFTLKALGKPFNYQGVITKRYDVPALLMLLQVERSTLYRWVDKGLFPQPAISVQGHHRVNYWFYHQVQPFFVWYYHMKARGIHYVGANANADQIAVLQRMYLAQERYWYKKLGVEYTSEYLAEAGKYGVISLKKDS